MADLHLVKNCIFCKIIQGEIPSFKLYEDGLTYAFMDINPLNDGHALVIPKYHAENIHTMPAEWLGPTMSTVQSIATAINKVVQPEGINLLQANGPGAKQSVFHFHMHVIPRYVDDGAGMNWEIKPGDMDAIGKLAERIAAAVE